MSAWTRTRAGCSRVRCRRRSSGPSWLLVRCTSRVPDSRSPLPRWTVPVVAAAILLVSAAALVVLWVWIDSLRFADVDKRATAHLEAVKVASAIAVGGGGLFALYLAARRQRTQELELEVRREELHGRDLDAAERRVTELYTKAADQLGSDKAPVRLAGMYALDRLANDNPQHRQVVIDLLCAYLRMPYPAADSTQGQKAEEREVRMTAQRLLATRSRPFTDPERPEQENPKYWPELFEFDLTGATLADFNMSGCRVSLANFGKAVFVGDATFARAVFRDVAEFSSATFGGVVGFEHAVFEHAAEFGDARFEHHTEFSSAQFRAFAYFVDASFDGRAVFAGTLFDGEGVFERAEFASYCTFIGAIFRDGVDFVAAGFAGSTEFSDVKFGRGSSFENAAFSVRPDLDEKIVDLSGLMIGRESVETAD
ncbi:pentapeptide repeat-containing protein [Lentzea sp. NPDC005914]|uniref:pentapeptide repeat-containing protein n=1 Tax=Lentzea sp. NPDC005914 TaxID=3154572 RepID=UPI0033C056E2